MKPVAVTVIIFSVLLCGLIVLIPAGTSADGKLHSNSNNQLAAGCCQGKRGNVNGAGITDLADLSALVSYLTGGGFVLPCPDAANVNGVGIVDLADLSALVSCLSDGACGIPDCPMPPMLTTASVSGTTQTTAQCGGTISSEGGASVAARGVCWSTNPTPTVADSKTTDGTGTGSFTSSLTGLTAGTIYYVRAYATNSIGTGYGNIASFLTTDSIGTVTDIDANVYRTVKIGTLWWMAENLKVAHYRNGDTIPNVTDGAAWAALTTGAYCDYDNDVNNVATYGRLYNWYAVSDSLNIAPAGWHVASDSEWKQLEMTLGMSPAQADSIDWRGTTEGGKLKEAGTTHWLAPNVGATNEGGFSALPGGYRFFSYGSYVGIGYTAYFWSSKGSKSVYYTPYRYLYYNRSDVYRSDGDEAYGFSVRCVKDY